MCASTADLGVEAHVFGVFEANSFLVSEIARLLSAELVDRLADLLKLLSVDAQVDILRGTAESSS